MKSYLLLVVAYAVFFFSNTSLNAGCDGSKIIPCGKIYVHPEQVQVNELGIFVFNKDLILQIPAIYQDDNGFYFQEIRGNCEGDQWECSVCHSCNPPLYFWCNVCDNPRW